nr:MAG TPA: hypothetical protein [Caudoviricetes sp.]
MWNIIKYHHCHSVHRSVCCKMDIVYCTKQEMQLIT